VTPKTIWNFCVLGSMVGFVLTGHGVAAFLFAFLFAGKGD
jgi:hypothetical protein